MKDFLSWIAKDETIDDVLKAGLAHLWFITIHPFDDGNGRIARAITDMLLARADKTSLRFYSMSAQIQVERKYYYEILEQTQKGTLDVTVWLVWFLRETSSYPPPLRSCLRTKSPHSGRAKVKKRRFLCFHFPYCFQNRHPPFRTYISTFLYS